MARRISPSEEVLAHWIVQNQSVFQNKVVVELGAGLGLAGLVCSSVTDATEVVLTDGDSQVMSFLEDNVQRNRELFGKTRVSTAPVDWNTFSAATEHVFDYVIAADVVYEESMHIGLLFSLKHLLKPSGKAIIIASRRGGSLEKFVKCAKSQFLRYVITDLSVYICITFNHSSPPSVVVSSTKVPVFIRSPVS